MAKTEPTQAVIAARERSAIARAEGDEANAAAARQRLAIAELELITARDRALLERVKVHQARADVALTVARTAQAEASARQADAAARLADERAAHVAIVTKIAGREWRQLCDLDQYHLDFDRFEAEMREAAAGA